LHSGHRLLSLLLQEFRGASVCRATITNSKGWPKEQTSDCEAKAGATPQVGTVTIGSGVEEAKKGLVKV
jgi:hypothetical protein